MGEKQKQKNNIKAENFVLFDRLSADLNSEDSLSFNFEEVF